MKDRLVALYVALVLLQLPAYYALGKGPLSFDFSIQAAEKGLRTSLGDRDEQERVESLLDDAEGELKASGDESSRWARLALDRGILDWKRGRSAEAMKSLQESYRLFEEKHGPDSFHVAAVDLRIAELQFIRGQYPEALIRFERSVPVVGDYLGRHTAFPIRMTYRQVGCLVALGRNGEAASLAESRLSELLAVIGEQDKGFAHRTGSALDILSLKGLLPVPPAPFRTWKSALVDRGKSQEAKEKVDE